MFVRYPAKFSSPNSKKLCCRETILEAVIEFYYPQKIYIKHVSMIIEDKKKTFISFLCFEF